MEDLFIQQATWLGHELQMNTARFLEWLTSYVEVKDRDFILQALPFFQTRKHRWAEETLCELLETDFRTQQKVRSTSTRIHRKTDWPRTYIKAYPLAPQRYHIVETKAVPDHILLGILAALARSWAGIARKLALMFNDGHDFAMRAESLENAVHSARSRGIRPCPGTLTSHYQQTIRRMIPPEKAKTFLDILLHWNNPIQQETAKQLALLLKRMPGPAQAVDNQDTLFELTTHLSILRAAREKGWILDGTSSGRDVKNTSFCFQLRKNGFFCRLGKGNPKKIFPESSIAKKDSDRMLGLRRLAIENFGGSGYEPDIVLGFYRTGQENSPIVVFGDAKNYKNSEISKAYKETVASTMVAYGHWAGLSITNENVPAAAFNCPVRPFFTLFCVLKDTVTMRPPSKQRDEDNPDAIPVVLTFPLTDMEKFGDNSELNQWFSKINERVDKVLGK